MRKAFRIASLVVAIAVLGALVGGATVRRFRLHRAAPFTVLTRTYLERALAGDSLALVARSTDLGAVAAALTLARTQPVLVRQALATLRPSATSGSADERVIWYASAADWCAGAVGATTLQATFIRSDSGWKVHFVGPGIC